MAPHFGDDVDRAPGQQKQLDYGMPRTSANHTGRLMAEAPNSFIQGGMHLA